MHKNKKKESLYLIALKLIKTTGVSYKDISTGGEGFPIVGLGGSSLH